MPKPIKLSKNGHFRVRQHLEAIDEAGKHACPGKIEKRLANSGELMRGTGKRTLVLE
jgi:hypothetical protein